LINTLGHGKYTARRAGTKPVRYVHPKYIETLQQHGIDVSEQHSKAWGKFEGNSFDLVITVCDKAANESCSEFSGSYEKLHWSILDPAQEPGTDDEINAAFDEAFNQLKSRIENELL
ncbi:MAG: arsenate reductase ArsC, partial [Arenicella sp.]|nr:arsenate reductase ArsC [Arenicella sp.]